jgi:two-component system, sensor histidine kinase LadS
LKKIIFSFLFLLVYFSSFSKAYSPIYIQETKQFEFNKDQIGIFEDTNNTITIQQILLNNPNIKFDALKLNSQNYGFTNSGFWLKLDFINKTNNSNYFLLSIQYPLINEVSYYETSKNNIIDSIITGENYPHSSRKYFDRNFTFKVFVNGNTNKTIFIHLFNNGETIRIPISLINITGKTDFGNNETFRRSLYYGYVLFALIFNFLMAFQFRKKHNFLLVAYIFCMSIFLFVIDGFAFQYFWPNSPYISNHSVIFFSMIASISLIRFSQIFLNFTGKIKKISIILIILAIIVFINNIIPSSIQKYSFLIANIYVFIAIWFILISSIYKYLKNKNLYNFIFLLSFVIIISAVMVYILRNLGILDVSLLTDYSLKIGFASQMTLLSLATITQFKVIVTDSNKFLEEMVEKRTNQISSQNISLRNQNNKIQTQIKEITQSINYAKRIQRAILPNKYIFSSIFKDHLIYYKPKDIVSGDFYWIIEKNHNTYIVAADCTGHGVPGGFLSMLGISFLNQIISNNDIIRPNEILYKLAVLFSATINNHEDSLSRDSMDISICKINHRTNIMEYSGAFNPIFIIRKDSLIELLVDKISLQDDFTNENKSFTNKTFQLEQNDKIYMFSDGYQDQFGGEFNKRFSKRNFKELLVTSAHLNMQDQKILIEDTFEKWKGHNEQIDDILIIGMVI